MPYRHITMYYSVQCNAIIWKQFFCGEVVLESVNVTSGDEEFFYEFFRKLHLQNTNLSIFYFLLILFKILFLELDARLTLSMAESPRNCAHLIASHCTMYINNMSF